MGGSGRGKYFVSISQISRGDGVGAFSAAEQGEESSLGRLGDGFRRGGEEALHGADRRDDGRPSLA